MQSPSVRRPAVAGRFYPGHPAALARDLDVYLEATEPPESAAPHEALACVVPHAGYMYSGRVAGAVYRLLPARRAYIVVGPNHFGRGAPLALSPSRSWLTPLGEVPVDQQLAQSLRRHCRLLTEDADAHLEEHSLEVQVPFLQRRFRGFSIVPVALATGAYSALELLGHALASAVGEAPSRPFIVVSSDFNHYEPDSITRVKDRKAIDQILALDPRGLYDVVQREQISMCGFAPAVAMLVAARELGAARAELVKYATSADAGGDPGAVVGYGGLLIG